MSRLFVCILLAVLGFYELRAAVKLSLLHLIGGKNTKKHLFLQLLNHKIHKSDQIYLKMLLFGNFCGIK